MTEAPIPPGSSFDTLHQLHRWVGWRWETRKGKPTKPPHAPGSGRYASVSDPGTWGSHEEALAMPGVDGIGIVLTGHPNIAACDLDHCRDPATGALAAWAQALIEQAGSYVEITPSHAGLRIVGLARDRRAAFRDPEGGERREGRGLCRRRQPLHHGHRRRPARRPLADITPMVER